ncbi:MAG: N-acetylmuramoyl-L-alanine amidase [Clostridia bacterium]|nr:N-acetylmuramoyl-L-alanine amidase [Clostridia bacterium]
MRVNKKLKKNIMLFCLVVIVLFSALLRSCLEKGENDLSSESNKESDAQCIAQETELKALACLNDVVGDDINISKYYVYGTNFNIEGEFKLQNQSNVQNISLSLRTDKGKETEYDLKYEVVENSILFKVSDKINGGIYLDDLTQGDYYLLIKVAYDDEKIEYYSMKNNTQYSKIEYYTITKNDSNNSVNIGFDNYNNKDKECSYLKVDVEKCELPKDVYDIAIDAGHGGTDTGATNKSYKESEFTLTYAKALKASLEKLGLKVKLTRDGTESSSEQMAFTIFDEDGRVNKAGASKAKYCFSIHLNSNEEDLESGGLQIYCNSNLNTKFAESLADNIVKYTDINYSNMQCYKVADGVFVRNYTQEEIEGSASAAASKGFAPYNITSDTNYYFVIRELGGIATNAYIDGRNSKYGKNNYYNSNIGIESYLLELGYITVDKDLKIIINQQDEYIKALTNSIATQVGIN